MTAFQGTADPTDVAGKRLVAALIDMILFAILVGILFSAFGEQGDTFGVIGCEDIEGSFKQCLVLNDTIYLVEGGEAAVVSLIELAYLIGIFVAMRGLTGKTPGTIAMGLRCVDEAGQPIGIGKGFVRSIAGIVDYIPCCFPLVGVITIFAAKGHRRVGDMAAKTFMVDQSAMGRPVVVPGLTMATATFAAPYGGPAAAPGPAGPAAPPAAPGATAQGPPPAPGQPQWDPARAAYIQWDAATQRWLQHDTATDQWRPIDT